MCKILSIKIARRLNFSRTVQLKYKRLSLEVVCALFGCSRERACVKFERTCKLRSRYIAFPCSDSRTTVAQKRVKNSSLISGAVNRATSRARNGRAPFSDFRMACKHAGRHEYTFNCLSQECRHRKHRNSIVCKLPAV